jgi:F0F1-type ATP synthase assembly protein I
MKMIGLVGSAILLLVGGLFLGQGLGYIQGSFMTGASLWAYIGGGLMVVGVALAVLSLRRPALAPAPASDQR